MQLKPCPWTSGTDPSSTSPHPRPFPTSCAMRTEGRRWRRPWSASRISCAVWASQVQFQLRTVRLGPAWSTRRAIIHEMPGAVFAAGVFVDHALCFGPIDTAAHRKDAVAGRAGSFGHVDNRFWIGLAQFPPCPVPRPRRLQVFVRHISQFRQPATGEVTGRVLVGPLFDRIVNARCVDNPWCPIASASGTSGCLVRNR